MHIERPMHDAWLYPQGLRKGSQTVAGLYGEWGSDGWSLCLTLFHNL